MAARKKTNKLDKAKRVLGFYAFLFVAWGFYRLLFQFPDPLEELIAKPLVWLLPLLYIARKEKLKWSDLGFRHENLFQVIYFMIFLGFLFSMAAMLVNYMKYGMLDFGANIGEGLFITSILLSFATAFSEEVAFRGYIFGSTSKILGNEWKANIISSIGWTFIHMPIAIFDWKLAPVDLLIFLVLVFSFSIGATFVYARTKNIAGPIMLHVMWQWPIILFR